LHRTKRSTNTGVLSSRDCEILEETIRIYTLSGEPVSSRSIAKRRGGELSAATIRNVMADLEDLGYLAQPHTSAGRVPTRAGYHFYIDSLMRSRGVSVRDRRQIEETLNAVLPDSDHLMASASHLLSELTQQIGIVITPSLAETILQSVSFVNLSESKVLCVVVSDSGFVDNKVIETDTPVPREELIRISNYLTDTFSGLALSKIRDRLLRLMAEDRATMDRLLANAMNFARQALLESERPDVLVEGTAALLSQPELNDIERVRRLLETFADKAELVSVLSHLIEGPGVRVVIGKDSDLTSGLDFSLVATPYGIGEHQMGTVGIFGPSRMEYQKVIPLVNYFGERLSRVLEKSVTDR
jgi:heat-inducible transcriptional repressor